ncbi:hypothetical protein [Kushneria aurantia]|uniref:Restriction endonuclease subunit R n=1 Tax=Kushneria aurantia TaxID=504092 RepID=A0ABV6G0F3_9GAMM|nr:hypothetical protein [Kushneria aurantia]
MTENQLEQLCLEWFTENSWETAHGPDIAHDGASPEREDYRQMLLRADLGGGIVKINQQLPDSAECDMDCRGL